MKNYYRQLNNKEQGLTKKSREKLNRSYRQHQKKNKTNGKILKRRIAKKKNPKSKYR